MAAPRRILLLAGVVTLAGASQPETLIASKQDAGQDATKDEVSNLIANQLVLLPATSGPVGKPDPLKGQIANQTNKVLAQMQKAEAKENDSLSRLKKELVSMKAKEGKLKTAADKVESELKSSTVAKESMDKKDDAPQKAKPHPKEEKSAQGAERHSNVVALAVEPSSSVSLLTRVVVSGLMAFVALLGFGVVRRGQLRARREVALMDPLLTLG